MSLQRNVQQQNDLTFEGMLARAQFFRVDGVPPGARNFFAMQGIDIDTSVIIHAISESYMLGFDFGFQGMLLTADHKFFTFDLEFNAALTEVLSVHEFSDVTSQQNISVKNKGTGKGLGALAVAVLQTMNAA